MEKIKGSLSVIEDVRELLEEYKLNQNIAKIKLIDLYKEFEELKVFRDNYIKLEKL